MGHTPYGYRIENGMAVIDEAAAAQVRKLYKNYLSGLSLVNAAKEAGLDLLHSGAKRMMRNKHYLGDSFYDEIADKIFKLREQRQKCTVDTAARDAQIARINDLQDFIKEQRTNLAEFDEVLVKRWLGQITVWDDHFIVELKSGLKIDIEG